MQAHFKFILFKWVCNILHRAGLGHQDCGIFCHLVALNVVCYALDACVKPFERTNEQENVQASQLHSVRMQVFGINIFNDIL